MVSPFAFPDAKPFLLEMSRAADAAALLEQTLQKFDQSVMADDPSAPLPEAVSVRTWLGCCLLDAVLNGIDYTEQAKASGMADEFRLAVRALDEALTRQKGVLFFRKPLHDTKSLVWNARECLMLFNDEDSEFVQKHAQSDEEWAELTEATDEVYEHLDNIYDSIP